MVDSVLYQNFEKWRSDNILYQDANSLVNAFRRKRSDPKKKEFIDAAIFTLSALRPMSTETIKLKDAYSAGLYTCLTDFGVETFYEGLTVDAEIKIPQTTELDIIPLILKYAPLVLKKEGILKGHQTNLKKHMAVESALKGIIISPDKVEIPKEWLILGAGNPRILPKEKPIPAKN